MRRDTTVCIACFMCFLSWVLRCAADAALQSNGVREARTVLLPLFPSLLFSSALLCPLSPVPHARTCVCVCAGAPRPLVGSLASLARCPALSCPPPSPVSSLVARLACSARREWGREGRERREMQGGRPRRDAAHSPHCTRLEPHARTCRDLPPPLCPPPSQRCIASLSWASIPWVVVSMRERHVRGAFHHITAAAHATHCTLPTSLTRRVCLLTFSAVCRLSCSLYFLNILHRLAFAVEWGLREVNTIYTHTHTHTHKRTRERCILWSSSLRGLVVRRRQRRRLNRSAADAVQPSRSLRCFTRRLCWTMRAMVAASCTESSAMHLLSPLIALSLFPPVLVTLQVTDREEVSVGGVAEHLRCPSSPTRESGALHEAHSCIGCSIQRHSACLSEVVPRSILPRARTAIPSSPTQTHLSTSTERGAHITALQRPVAGLATHTCTLRRSVASLLSI